MAMLVPATVAAPADAVLRGVGHAAFQNRGQPPARGHELRLQLGHASVAAAVAGGLAACARQAAAARRCRRTPFAGWARMARRHASVSTEAATQAKAVGDWLVEPARKDTLKGVDEAQVPFKKACLADAQALLGDAWSSVQQAVEGGEFAKDPCWRIAGGFESSKLLLVKVDDGDQNWSVLQEGRS
eukprot:TRINITY_DN27772_c0_g1_i1.p1 TRINITY_DN27772_c0_g1~~TRINITY_DN27772_c0_g1_i1.p1  ORF type:complete len:207 (-),score=39.72 TRINITY_DN27772_c0_g1_i1:456-1013(-)